MIGDHGRFEALAGAVMLGETTAAERAAFDVHASTCATCGEDLAGAPLVRAAIGRAGAAETWRPSIGSLVLGRIRDGRRSRFRTTIGALGWAVAVSIVFNVALASGIASRFSPLGSGGDAPSSQTAMRIELESPAPHLRAAAVPPRAAVAVARRRGGIVGPAVVARATARPVSHPSVSVEPADDAANVLAGLDLDGSSDAKHVAVEPQPQPHCSPAVGTVAADATDDATRCAQNVRR